MADANVCAWHPSAAYLYVLELDGPALAWEYLRRNPAYVRAWEERTRAVEQAAQWGLRLLEDPLLDARQAQPAWFPEHRSVMQLYPDLDPPPAAQRFDFWSIPGDKQLLHDGRRLLVSSWWPGHRVRFLIAPGLADGAAYLVALRAPGSTSANQLAINIELRGLSSHEDDRMQAQARGRPSAAALLELRTLQALDARLAGVSLRQTAVGLFGAEVTSAGWYADGGLRSRVRRLVSRGQSLMHGGYRRLAQLD